MACPAGRQEGRVMSTTWRALLLDQLEFYWAVHLQPRLEGLSDEEYFWEPVAGCWSLRPAENGRYTLDGLRPEPSPPPVTTIAWRLVHVGALCLANRASAFFGGERAPRGVDMFDPRHVPTDLPGSAAQAVVFLEEAYQAWHDGVATLSDADLQRPLGAKGGPFAADPMAGLILHINREVMHHGGELGLLRDLYRATGSTSRRSRLVATP